MEVVTLLLFIGAVWGVGAGFLFFFHIKTAGHQHADRLALLPLDDNWNDPCTEQSDTASYGSSKPQ